MEQWIKIPDYGYEVSNKGRFRRYKKGRGAIIGKILKQVFQKDGYKTVCLSNNGKGKIFLSHRIIARFFCKNSSKEKDQVNHINGNKSDNRIKNLEWVTRTENYLHARRCLGVNIGEDSWNAKLTEQSVKKIRAIYEKGRTQRFLSKQFGVSQTRIAKIVNRKAWIHVD